jgi:ubiquitin C-terminal hydrolase
MKYDDKNKEIKLTTPVELEKTIEIPINGGIYEHILRPNVYKLVLKSLVIHYGGDKSGHYINYSYRQDKWYRKKNKILLCFYMKKLKIKQLKKT